MSVLAVVGPTAVGKSALALAIVEHLHAQGRAAEIVNADSMQLYRGMDIGTAKATADEQARVPHHLLDIWPVTQSASVAQYQDLARETITQIADRGAVPILVGGSGLYVRAVLDHMEFPGTDPLIRQRLEEQAQRDGAAAMHAQLAAVDPAAAAAILPDNTRRIVRALEVVQLRGSFTATLPAFEYAVPAVQIGLRRDRASLDRRVDARAEKMFADGLLTEVRALVAQGLRAGPTASRALGYAQALELLDGERDLAQTIAATQQATRRFVRRQESWFGRDPRVQWLDADALSTDELAARALDHYVAGASTMNQ